ncbi:hypothetical protein BS47DRAFT_627495 [Hydnum rufescens UP504]|uniref:Uncharacterized protein n=1 Tax=Hydnum rufescens UP504 TaxID=1448309 RepID=A0A9P6B4C0_9AGAM|nr:hypothetical protein BS47DRAFT_627495 [Hydnum rufescens UP504]
MRMLLRCYTNLAMIHLLHSLRFSTTYHTKNRWLTPNSGPTNRGGRQPPMEGIALLVHNRVVSVHNDDESHLLQVLDRRRGSMGAGRPRGPRPRNIDTARRDNTGDPVQPFPGPVGALPPSPFVTKDLSSLPSPMPVIRSLAPPRTYTPHHRVCNLSLWTQTRGQQFLPPLQW